jgi:acyl carrier protein
LGRAALFPWGAGCAGHAGEPGSDESADFSSAAVPVTIPARCFLFPRCCRWRYNLRDLHGPAAREHAWLVRLFAPGRSAPVRSSLQGAKSMPPRDEIFEKVRNALVDALGVDEDDVKPDATMVGDLGAESIDFLDIVFRLEKAFGIKIPRGELFPEDVLSSSEFVNNGKVNAAGIAALKSRMPFADLSKFEANPSVQNFANTLTVEDMVRYVQSKLAA